MRTVSGITDTSAVRSHLGVVVCGVVLVAALGISGAAGADCCMGPPIAVWLPLNTPLSATLHPVVSNDDPDHPASGSVHAYLKVGSTRIADLGTVQTQASTIPHEIAFSVPAAARSRARLVARQAHRHRGVITFAIRATDSATGTPSRTYGMDAFVTLGPPTPTRGPTRISLATTTVAGAVAQRLTGSLLMPTPRGWPQTSQVGEAPATFGPLAIGPTCTANVVAQPTAVATSSVATYVSQIGGPGGTVASGGSAGRIWRVRATGPSEPFPRATAIGLLRLAHRRYAGLRIDVSFSPRCHAIAARDPKLIKALRHGVRDLTVHARRAA